MNHMVRCGTTETQYFSNNLFGGGGGVVSWMHILFRWFRMCVMMVWYYIPPPTQRPPSTIVQRGCAHGRLFVLAIYGDYHSIDWISSLSPLKSSSCQRL